MWILASMRVVGSGEAVSLVSLGSGKATRRCSRILMGRDRGHRPRLFLERSRSIAGWGEIRVADLGVWSAVGRGEFRAADPGFLCF